MYTEQSSDPSHSNEEKAGTSPSAHTHTTNRGRNSGRIAQRVWLSKALRRLHRQLGLLLSLLAAATLYSALHTKTAARLYGSLSTPLAFALPALLLLSLARTYRFL
jgi:hypothetical protein